MRVPLRDRAVLACACFLGLLAGCKPLSTAPPSSPAGPLPEIPAASLPPQTRPKPDPDRDPYVRDPVYLRIEATVKASSGAEGPPQVPVLQNHMAEYFRRSGHPVLAAPEGAAHRIEGTFRGEHDKTLMLLDTPANYRYKGTGRIRVLDRDGREIEAFEVPDIIEFGVSEEPTEVRLERHMANLLWEHLSVRSVTFGNPRVVEKIGSLAQDPSLFLPAEGNGELEPLSAENVIEDLVKIGFPAVPFLLDALNDNRVVRLNSKYPGLESGKLDALRIYHVADKALEEIFQKVSRMSIQITADDPESDRLRRVIVLGWENEWRRFCPAFRESPNAPRRKAAESGKQGGKG